VRLAPHLLAQALPLDPELLDACGEDPGAACRFVFERTDNAFLAKAADALVATPLKILLIVAVAYLLNRIVRRAIRRFADRLAGSASSGRLKQARERAPSLLVTQSQPTLRSAARASTIAEVLRSLATFVIYAFAFTYVLAELGLDLGPLLAGAGVVGVALGFGAQSLVRDFLTGMFILIEDQYGVGDVVDVGEASGAVEAVSLRTTRLRDVNGTVWHVPNGEIRRVGNKSQEWARALLDINVALGTDVARAAVVMKEVADEVCASPELRAQVLEEAEVWGVEQLMPEGITIRLVVKTTPGSQWTVMRALRRAIKDAFEAEGIELAVPFGGMVVRRDEAGPAPLPPPDRP
jgi:small conductance mechanosensitive channel